MRSLGAGCASLATMQIDVSSDRPKKKHSQKELINRLVRLSGSSDGCKLLPQFAPPRPLLQKQKWRRRNRRPYGSICCQTKTLPHSIRTRECRMWQDRLIWEAECAVNCARTGAHLEPL